MQISLLKQALALYLQISGLHGVDLVKMIAPVLEEIDSEMGDKVKIVKLDVDDNQETASKYGVMSIPTLLVFKNGEVVDKVVGFQPKDALASVLEKHA